MHKVKIFKSTEADIRNVEDEVNAWLAEHQPKIVDMFGNIAPQTLVDSSKAMGKRAFTPSDVLLVILYEAD